MAEAPSLATVQRWMQAILVHPESAEAGLASPDAVREIAPERIGDVVLPNDRLTSIERVGIYQEMYLLRMEEALSSDYPALVRVLGDHAFSHLVADYVEVHPSRSYTLNRLGDHLPRFLEGWGPKKDRRLLAEIARLELALTEAFDAPELTPERLSFLAAVGGDGAEKLRFVASASLRLVSVRRASLDAYEALKAEERIPAARSGSVTAVFHRREDEVRRFDLSSPADRFLADLVAGKTLGDALARLTRHDVAPDAVTRWLSEWIGDGLFVRLSLPEKPV